MMKNGNLTCIQESLGRERYEKKRKLRANLLSDRDESDRLDMDIESVLCMCYGYDSIEPLDSKYSIVWKQGLCGLLSMESFSELMHVEYTQILKMGNHIMVQSSIDYLYKSYDYDTLELEDNEFNKEDINSIVPLEDGKAWVVWSGGLKGLLNSDFELVLPVAYSKIYISHRFGSKIALKVELYNVFESQYKVKFDSYSYRTNSNRTNSNRTNSNRTNSMGVNFINNRSKNGNGTCLIVADSEYKQVDCYGAMDTMYEGVQIAVSSLGVEYGDSPAGVVVDTIYTNYNDNQDNQGNQGNQGRRKVIKPKFKLRHEGQLLGDEVSLIDDAYAELGKFNWVRTYIKHSNGSVTCGVQALDGTRILQPFKYRRVRYIGNNIFVVEDQDGNFGTVVNGIEVVKCGEIDNISIMKGIPFTVCRYGNQGMYIGNDGCLYDKLEEAYGVMRSKVKEGLRLINLYGKKLVIDGHFKLLKGEQATREIMNQGQWELCY